MALDPHPLVSIIIPTCRRNALALECIDSILANRYARFEIVIVDQDVSRSLASEVAERYPDEKRISYHFLEIQALDAARNRGIERSSGSIVIFADDDVQVDSRWLEAYVEAFTAVSPQPAVVGGRIDPVWLNGRPEWMPPEHEYLLGLYPQEYPLGPMREGDLPIGANFATLRRYCSQVEPFDTRFCYSYSRKNSLISGGDSLFALGLKRKGYPICYQPAARVWHKISRSKLNRRYMMRRNFWEGVSYVAVQFVSAGISSTDCPGIIRWHLGNMLRQPFRALSQMLFTSNNDPRSRVLARMLFGCARSAGILKASMRLLVLKRLP